MGFVLDKEEGSAAESRLLQLWSMEFSFLPAGTKMMIFICCVDLFYYLKTVCIDKVTGFFFVIL